MDKCRISLGSASCDGHERRDGIERGACEQLLAQLEALERLSVAQLGNLPEKTIRTVHIKGKSVSLATYKKGLGSDELLLVVQAFVETWWFPTYFSANGIGKMFAEGIVVRNGEVHKAAESELWPYR